MPEKEGIIMKNKEDTKIDNTKIEGLKVVSEKDSHNPAKEKEIEEEVFISPIKIGDKEYIVKPLSMRDVRKLNIEKNKIKKDDEMATYDFAFQSMLTTLQKFNPELKDTTVEEFEDMIELPEFERVQKAILQISGLQKYFFMGDSGKS